MLRMEAAEELRTPAHTAGPAAARGGGGGGGAVAAAYEDDEGYMDGGDADADAGVGAPEDHMDTVMEGGVEAGAGGDQQDQGGLCEEEAPAGPGAVSEPAAARTGGGRMFADTPATPADLLASAKAVHGWEEMYEEQAGEGAQRGSGGGTCWGRCAWRGGTGRGRKVAWGAGRQAGLGQIGRQG